MSFIRNHVVDYVNAPMRSGTAKSGGEKILVILHQASSTPGRVGQLLEKFGFSLDIRRPALGQSLPDTLDDHAGAVIFGGPMSANDPHEFIKRETDWLSVPLKENKPFLGICLGAQLLANHIGGRVGPDPAGAVEIGWYPIEATHAGTALFDWPEMVYHFHREGVYGLPKDATLLATGATYPNQAFRYGDNAWGLQFHAELTRVMMQRWVVHGAKQFSDKGAQPGRAHLEGRLIYDAPLRSWLEKALSVIFGKNTTVIARVQ